MNQFYGELRVDNGLRRIKVNDQGEYIEFSVNDSTFFDRFADLIAWVSKMSLEVEKYETEALKKLNDGEEKSESTQAEIIREIAKRRTDFYQGCCVQLDAIFGEGCCRKVFGNVIPDNLLIEDFFEQITPILESLGKERNEKISLKYNRNRKGANTELPVGNV